MRTPAIALYVFMIAAAAPPSYAQGASAQAYPNRPVRLVVGFPPGGGVDMVARGLSTRLSEKWGQSVVVDNRAGANGIIAAELVANAAPNGYTLLLSSAGALVISPHLGTKLSYDPLADLTPISVVSESAPLLAVNAAVAADSVKTLVALAKAKPGELTYGSSGIGGPNHMAGELFKSMAGVEMTHVPYKGSAPAVADLVGGQVKVMFGVIPALLPHVNAGKLKAIGVGALRRSSALPSVPTIHESGLKGYELPVWYGVVAPKGTPQPLVRDIHAAVVQALQTPELRSMLIRSGAEPIGSTPQEFASYIRSEYAKYARLVKAAGATNQ